MKSSWSLSNWGRAFQAEGHRVLCEHRNGRIMAKAEIAKRRGTK